MYYSSLLILLNLFSVFCFKVVSLPNHSCLNKIQSSLHIMRLAIKQQLKNNKHTWNDSSSPKKVPE